MPTYEMLMFHTMLFHANYIANSWKMILCRIIFIGANVLVFNYRIAGMFGRGKVWWIWWIAKLKSSKLVVTIDDFLADLIIRQTFLDKVFIHPNINAAKLFHYTVFNHASWTQTNSDRLLKHTLGWWLNLILCDLQQCCMVLYISS